MGARKTRTPVPPDAADKCTLTDLGIIKVETRDHRDVVFLAHNHLRAFALECFEDRPSELAVNDKFYEYSDSQIREVFTAYLQWKRATYPKFRLKMFTGRKKDGGIHPWRSGITNREKPTTAHDNDDGTREKDGTGGRTGDQTRRQGNHPAAGDDVR